MGDACPHLQALRAGCSVQQVSRDWSQARRVLTCAQPLPAALHTPVHADASVAYHRVPTSPHWPGDAGCFCKRCLVGMTFPLR
ncbi:hypothetical protein XspCFBP7912_10205 [Xanthomonas sp. CFBP 7912]|nr:hypothetical protein XspCFBP7912_10205 [Xanthomonas sp. CFBP 7912]RJS06090.1 hypothetical protein XnspCFBP7698_03465 [Xanthomonas sp. CFBP 7698]